MAMDVTPERLALANSHLVVALAALDHAHQEQGCHCPNGRCVLTQRWVPRQIRRDDTGEPVGPAPGDAVERLLDPDEIGTLGLLVDWLDRRGRHQVSADAVRKATAAAEACQDGACPAAEAVVEALMEVGGWDEIDGDGSPESVLADHIRWLPSRLADLAEEATAS